MKIGSPQSVSESCRCGYTSVQKGIDQLESQLDNQQKTFEELAGESGALANLSVDPEHQQSHSWRINKEIGIISRRIEQRKEDAKEKDGKDKMNKEKTKKNTRGKTPKKKRGGTKIGP